MISCVGILYAKVREEIEHNGENIQKTLNSRQQIFLA